MIEKSKILKIQNNAIRYNVSFLVTPKKDSTYLKSELKSNGLSALDGRISITFSKEMRLVYKPSDRRNFFDYNLFDNLSTYDINNISQNVSTIAWNSMFVIDSVLKTESKYRRDINKIDYVVLFWEEDRIEKYIRDRRNKQLKELGIE